MNWIKYISIVIAEIITNVIAILKEKNKRA